MILTPAAQAGLNKAAGDGDVSAVQHALPQYDEAW
jgi:hypothetical protein